MTPDELKDFINGLFKDRTTAADRRIDAGALRAGFGQVLDFMYGTFAALKETFTTKNVTTGQINGLVLNKSFQVVQGPGNAFYFLKIAQFLASSNGLRDVLSLDIAVGLFGGGKGRIMGTFSNRDGFAYPYSVIGDTAGCALVAYAQSDGRVVLYLRIPNDFRAGSFSVYHNYQVTVFPELPVEDPAGDECFDSLDPATYPPLQIASPTLLFTSGALQTGSAGKPFVVTSAKAGSSLSVKTTQYVEIIIDNIPYKLAICN